MCSKRVLQSNGSPRSSQVGINKRAVAVYSTKAGVVYNSRVGVPAGRTRLVNELVSSNVKLRVNCTNCWKEINYTNSWSFNFQQVFIPTV